MENLMNEFKTTIILLQCGFALCLMALFTIIVFW